MTRTVLTGALLAAAAAMVLGLSAPRDEAAGTTTRSAAGRGIMAFGDHGDARGLLRFSVREGETPTGSLYYAAEDHHHFPDVVVELGTVESARFTARGVTFSGPGTLHDDPVHVTVRAFDRGPRTPDRFVVSCTDGGVVVFEADGELIRGDIVVQPAGNGGSERRSER